MGWQTVWDGVKGIWQGAEHFWQSFRGLGSGTCEPTWCVGVYRDLSKISASKGVDEKKCIRLRYDKRSVVECFINPLSCRSLENKSTGGSRGRFVTPNDPSQYSFAGCSEFLSGLEEEVDRTPDGYMIEAVLEIYQVRNCLFVPLTNPESFRCNKGFPLTTIAWESLPSQPGFIANNSRKSIFIVGLIAFASVAYSNSSMRKFLSPLLKVLRSLCSQGDIDADVDTHSLDKSGTDIAGVPGIPPKKRGSRSNPYAQLPQNIAALSQTGEDTGLGSSTPSVSKRSAANKTISHVMPQRGLRGSDL